MCDQPNISPYLRRPLRSYEQVLRDLRRETHGDPAPGGQDARHAGDQALPRHSQTRRDLG